MPRKDLIAVRRGTAAEWTAANPVLAAGEPGLETDTGIFKVGDGQTPWLSLGAPAVPNPAPGGVSNAPASIGEVKDLLAGEPLLLGASTLYIGSFGAIPLFGAIVVNTTTESTLVSSPPELPALPAGATVRAVIGGDVRNQSGSSVDFTFRLYAGANEITELTVAVGDDTADRRPLRFEADLQAIGSGAINYSARVVVAPGDSDPAVEAISSSIAPNSVGSAGTLNCTVELSAASGSTVEVRRLLANLTYTLPPTP